MAEKKKVEKKFVEPEINIGLIGHVDSGKTSLVQALTGKWSDTHSEELKRGISIRLGYADVVFYKCAKCKEEAYSTEEKCGECKGKGKALRSVSFVDAPGHETLMTTMLSGAALMHGAILVIAANEDCPQAQTVEHLLALQVADVKNVVVVQNKIDLVDAKQAKKNYKQIKEFLKKTPYKDAEIIPVAAHFKTNIDLLIGALEKNVPTPKYDLKKPLKMYCIRSFDINKPGSAPKEIKGGVLGGTIIEGKAKEGDEIEIAPGIGKRIKTKISGMNISGTDVKEASPGGLIAVETLLDPSIAANDQMRGQIIAVPGILPSAVEKFELEVHALEDGSGNKFETNEKLVLTVGAMTCLATVTGLKGNGVELVVKSPVIVVPGQKIAISKRIEMKWRLVGYGIIK